MMPEHERYRQMVDRHYSNLPPGTLIEYCPVPPRSRFVEWMLEVADRVKGCVEPRRVAKVHGSSAPAASGPHPSPTVLLRHPGVGS